MAVRACLLHGWPGRRGSREIVFHDKGLDWCTLRERIGVVGKTRWWTARWRWPRQTWTWGPREAGSFPSAEEDALAYSNGTAQGVLLTDTRSRRRRGRLTLATMAA